MSDLARASAGAQVTYATSRDSRHPPSAIIDGKDNTFWASTGLFPQEFVIALAGVVSVSKISTWTANVKGIDILTCADTSPITFKRVAGGDLSARTGRVQQDSYPLSNVTARFVKVVIRSGWDDFVGVYKVSIEGSLQPK